MDKARPPTLNTELAKELWDIHKRLGPPPSVTSTDSATFPDVCKFASHWLHRPIFRLSQLSCHEYMGVIRAVFKQTREPQPQPRGSVTAPFLAAALFVMGLLVRVPRMYSCCYHRPTVVWVKPHGESGTAQLEQLLTASQRNMATRHVRRMLKAA